MKKRLFAILTAVLITVSITNAQEKFKPNWENLKQHKVVPEWFIDAKLGLYFIIRKGVAFSDNNSLNEKVPSSLTKFRHGHKDHEENFLPCIRTRETPISDVEWAHRAVSTGLLGEIACLTGEKLKWNPDQEKLVGASAQAKVLLSSNYHALWVLEGV